MYDMKLLSTYDGSLVAGTAKENLSEDGGAHSYLLVKGHLNQDPYKSLRISGIVPENGAVLTKSGE